MVQSNLMTFTLMILNKISGERLFASMEMFHLQGILTSLLTMERASFYLEEALETRGPIFMNTKSLKTNGSQSPIKKDKFRPLGSVMWAL